MGQVWRTKRPTTLSILLLLLLGTALGCSAASRLTEQISGQTPTARINRYINAIRDGDRRTALSLWVEATEANAPLRERRESVTDELLRWGPDMRHSITHITWWRTCCEPGVIDDPDEAGGAHIQVTVESDSHPPQTYEFYVSVPGGYWGSAAGSPPRQWQIVDIHPEGQDPLAWPWLWR